MSEPSKASTAAGRYEQLKLIRQPYVDRARANAELTIPHLVPPEGSSGATSPPQPYQSLGSEGVNNLTAKALLALFPPDIPFFRMRLDAATLAELVGSEDLKTEVEAALAQIEKEVMVNVDTSAIRATVTMVLKHLINDGNSLLHIHPSGAGRYYKLTDYVVKRSPSGELIEGITHEKVSLATLSPLLQALVKSDSGKPASPDDNLDLYTWFRLVDGRWRIHQELAGKVVPESHGWYPKDGLPFIALRWSRVDGEDYGRAMVEEYFGDLRAAEALQKAIVEGAAALAKLLFFVDPSGTTRLKDVSDSKNLDVKPGKASDVSVLQAQTKAGDFNVAFQALQGIERRWARAFLLTSSVSRNAERVTAEEIRLLAGELEDRLSGTYVLLAQELQLPLVRVLLANLQRQGKIPTLPKSVIPTIVTGLEALGRSHEVNLLMTFCRVMREMLGDNVAETLHVEKVGQSVATSIGLDPGLVKTRQEIQADREAQARQNMMQQLGPEAIRAQTTLNKTSMEQNANGASPQE